MYSPALRSPLAGLLCLCPALWLAWLAVTAGLGANPIEKVIHQTGDWTLRFLLLSLAITPLCRLTGWSWPAPLRPWLGFFSLFYGILHFLAYALLDQGLSWSAIGDDVLKRRYISVGLASLLLLFPPAIASAGGVKRLLGEGNRRLLQYPVYAAAVGGVVHYLWLVKRDMRRPLAYAVALFLLLGCRVAVALLRQRPQRSIRP